MPRHLSPRDGKTQHAVNVSGSFRRLCDFRPFCIIISSLFPPVYCVRVIPFPLGLGRKTAGYPVNVQITHTEL